MGNENELEEQSIWLDRWMATKPWDNRGRASTDQRDPIKTVEIDTSQPYSYLAPNFRRPNPVQCQSNQFQRPNSHSIASPLHKAHQNVSHHPSHLTPSPSKTRPLQMRSASPRCGREDRSFHASQTPSLRSNYYYNGRGTTAGGGGAGASALPNYMAATESAKARVRSQSAPRQRPSTPERERGGHGSGSGGGGGSVRKRLSFPAPDPYSSGIGYGGYVHLRSPSFKSVSGGYLGSEQKSNYSSCCTESFGGEISPSSTSDLRRWMT